jgi:SAM-dependent methyltransferase
VAGDREDGTIPEPWFTRQDESPDELFYDEPRFVAHIDQATIDALTGFYREFIPPGSRVLDLMSSWISHLPPDVDYAEVAGLGMNATELKANPRLDRYSVQNLNEHPELPFEEQSFDRILIAVSIQYLIRPIEVMRSAHRVLADDGAIVIAMSHRLFPTKAIQAFRLLGARERIQLVGHYLDQAGFEEIEFIDRSPPAADPMWLVTGRRT